MIDTVLSWLSRLEPVHRAETAAERLAIARLRYRVYVEEQGDRGVPGADHERGIVSSDADALPDTLLLYTGPADRPTGTMRAVRVPAGGAPASVRDRYAFDRFPVLGERPGVEVGFFITDPSFRGTGSSLALACRMLELTTREHGTELVFSMCSPGLLRPYGKLGLRPYGARPVSTPRGVQIPILAVLADLAHLRRVGSPVLHVLRRARREGALPADDLRALLSIFEDAEPTVQTDLQGISDALEASSRAGSFLDDLPPGVRDRLTRSCVLSIDDGTPVVETGYRDRDMFVILDGAFEVVMADRVVRTMGPGDIFGEVAFFGHGGARSATVRAVGPGQVLVLRHRMIGRMRDEAPGDALAIYEAIGAVMADRLASG